MTIETGCPVCGSVNCGCYAAAPYRGLSSREEDESNIRHGQADTEDAYRLKDGEACSHPGCLQHVRHPCEGCGRVAGRANQAQKSKIDLSDHRDACDCEAMPGEEKWKQLYSNEASGVEVYSCNFCGKEVIV